MPKPEKPLAHYDEINRRHVEATARINAVIYPQTEERRAKIRKMLEKWDEEEAAKKKA